MASRPTGYFQAPALGPLMTVQAPGQSKETIRIGLGFAPSWGPPQALVLARRTSSQPDQDWIAVEQVLAWPHHPSTQDGSCHCMEAFDLKPSYFDTHPQLICLLAYGFDSMVAIKHSTEQWPDPLPANCTVSWPQLWRDGIKGGTCFAVASCQYPAGLLDAAPNAETWGPGPADASFDQLLRWRKQTHEAIQPAFALLPGDQIYADATAGLFDPQAVSDRFVQPYLTQMAHAYRNAALHNLPFISIPDDHEFQNDWEPAPHTKLNQERQGILEAGLKQYWHFQRMLSPHAQTPDHVWQRFTHHGASFFLADTRTERSHRAAATIEAARIMSDQQKQALLDWIATEGPAPHPKFMVCPSAVLPRRQRVHESRPASALFSDAWDGYPISLYQLLAALCDHQVQNFVMLSGDEHLSSLARIELQRLDQHDQYLADSHHPLVKTVSLHSSGWYAPYPFANSTPNDLRGRDAFRFSVNLGQGHQKHYHCGVSTTFYPGDGLALVHTTAEHQVRYRFLKAGNTQASPATWQNLI